MMTNLIKMAAAFCVLMACGLVSQAQEQAQPLRVYILVGQSNMEGHAMISTFDYIGDDPATAPLLDMMRDDNGQPVVSDRVRVSNLTGIRENNGVLNGPLAAGFGARRNPAELGDKIGPEFTFGLTIQEAYDGPILIIKTAWGGKSLHTDFRPPNAGMFEPSQAYMQNLANRAERDGTTFDPAAWQAERDAQTGHYYRLMMEHVQGVLADLDNAYPGYDADAGYELSGMVWFQGWNDMVDSNVYPNRAQPGGYDLYSRLMAQFISDVRSDLEAPQMPFVIGVMGVGGQAEEGSTQANFRAAMAAPTQIPAFRGNVAAVQTGPYWAEELAEIDAARGRVRQMAHLLRTENRNAPNADGSMDAQAQAAYLEQYRSEQIPPEAQAIWDRGASNAGYHYLGCGKTMAQIGQAFAQALVEMDDE